MLRSKFFLSFVTFCSCLMVFHPIFTCFTLILASYRIGQTTADHNPWNKRRRIELLALITIKLYWQQEMKLLQTNERWGSFNYYWFCPKQGKQKSGAENGIFTFRKTISVRSGTQKRFSYIIFAMQQSPWTCWAGQKMYRKNNVTSGDYCGVNEFYRTKKKWNRYRIFFFLISDNPRLMASRTQTASKKLMNNFERENR